jgi:uncharacterized Zn finger protein
MFDYYPPRSKPRDPKAQIAKLRQKNPDIQPVVIEGKLAKTWWAQAWNQNLEGYADYANRIGRGRSYVRKGCVVDLSIATGRVGALVQGSRAAPYKVTVAIDPLPGERWARVVERCSHRISSLEELAQGRFPAELSELFVSRGEGLFPSPREIHLGCSCPDWAVMCKHVAATLYGIGARFDEDSTLFFKLRDIDFADLLRRSVDEKMQSMLRNVGQATSRVMADADIFGMFGV